MGRKCGGTISALPHATDMTVDESVEQVWICANMYVETDVEINVNSTLRRRRSAASNLS